MTTKPCNEPAVLAAAAALAAARALGPALHSVGLRLSTEGVHVGMTRVMAAASEGAIFEPDFSQDAARLKLCLRDIAEAGTRTVVEYVETGFDGESEIYEALPVQHQTDAARAAAEGLQLIQSLIDHIQRTRDLIEAAKAVEQLLDPS